MKKSYKKRRKKIKGGNQTKELENLNNLFLNRKYKLAITKDGKEEMYDVKYTGPQLNSQGALSHKFSHIFKMQHSKFNTDSDLNSYSWKLLVPSISATGTSTHSNDGEQADRSPEQGGGKKKRSRKRSTKKKARNKKKTRKKKTMRASCAPYKFCGQKGGTIIFPSNRPDSTFSNIQDLKDILDFYNPHNDNKIIIKSWNGNETEHEIKPEQTSDKHILIVDANPGISFSLIENGSFKIKPLGVDNYLTYVQSPTGGMSFKNPIYIYSRGDPLAPPPNAYYNPKWMKLMGQVKDSQESRVLLSNLDMRKASAWMKFKAKILEKNFLYYEKEDLQDLNLDKAVFKIIVSNKSQNEKIDNSHSFTRYKIKRSDLIESINNNSPYIPMYKGDSSFAITAFKSKLDQPKIWTEEEFIEAFWKQKETDLRIGDDGKQIVHDLISSGEVLEVLKELGIDYDEQNVYELFIEIHDDYGYGDEIDLNQFLILMKKLTEPKFEEVFLWGDEGILIGLIEINDLDTSQRDNVYFKPEDKNIVPIIFKSNREEQEKRKKERIIEKQKKAKSLKKKGGKRKRTRRRRR